jgi:hypothetical protein
MIVAWLCARKAPQRFSSLATVSSANVRLSFEA